MAKPKRSARDHLPHLRGVHRTTPTRGCGTYANYFYRTDKEQGQAKGADSLSKTCGLVDTHPLASTPISAFRDPATLLICSANGPCAKKMACISSNVLSGTVQPGTSGHFPSSTTSAIRLTVAVIPLRSVVSTKDDIEFMLQELGSTDIS